jgi:hypothetical protein
MTVTKTIRRKLKNNTHYYAYTLSLNFDVLQCIKKVVLAEWGNIAEIPRDPLGYLREV